MRGSNSGTLTEVELSSGEYIDYITGIFHYIFLQLYWAYCFKGIWISITPFSDSSRLNCYALHYLTIIWVCMVFVCSASTQPFTDLQTPYGPTGPITGRVAFMDRLISSYYNLLSVCAGENQGGNPIGKALFAYLRNTWVLCVLAECDVFLSLPIGWFFLSAGCIYLENCSV